MKILFFGDTHNNKEYLQTVIEKAKKVDIIVCIGDITIFERQLDAQLHLLNNIGKPVLMIHGNHEDDTTLAQACMSYPNIIFLHEIWYEKEDIVFFGYGGGGFSMKDSHFEIIAKKFIEEIPKHKKIILITHGPPYDTTLDYLDFMEDHVGNKTYRIFIEKHQPIIAVSGHLHENFNKEDTIGKTRVINPGPEGTIIEV